MNSNKKSTPASSGPQPLNPGSARQLKPLVAQLKTGVSAQSGKQPVAPPVYHPQQTPRVLQTKSSQSRQAGQVSHHPMAPPVYRPEAKKIVQPKNISQPGKLFTAPPVYRPEQINILPKMVSASPQRSRAVPGTTAHAAKIANSIRPIAAKRTAFLFSAVQMAEEEEKITPRIACGATVIANDGESYEGKYYKSIHAEIWALEAYLSSGGKLKDIAEIQITSAPCKYCTVILGDLGLYGKVTVNGRPPQGYGSCKGGSYGWFALDGSVWTTIKKTMKTKKYKDQDTYIAWVIERQREL